MILIAKLWVYKEKNAHTEIDLLKRFFTLNITLQFFISIISGLSSFAVNMHTTMYSVYIGLPFIIVEAFIGSKLLKENKPKGVKILLLVGTILMSVITGCTNLPIKIK